MDFTGINSFSQAAQETGKQLFQIGAKFAEEKQDADRIVSATNFRTKATKSYSDLIEKYKETPYESLPERDKDFKDLRAQLQKEADKTIEIDPKLGAAFANILGGLDTHAHQTKSEIFQRKRSDYSEASFINGMPSILQEISNAPDGKTVTIGRPEWGKREDGSAKGSGFYGPLMMTDGSGRVATEMSIGVTFGNETKQIPSIVPTLSGDELKHLLNGGEVTEAIAKKAVDHAKQRMDSGLDVFAAPGEPITAIPEGVARGERTKQDIADNYVMQIMAVYRGGALTKKQAEHLIVTFNEKYLASQVMDLIRANKFVEAQKLNEEKKYFLGDQYGPLSRVIEAKQDQFKETTAYNTLLEENGGDPLKAANSLNKPETMARFGLTLQNATHVRESLNGMHTNAEKAKKQAQEADLDKVYGVVQTGNLSRALSMLRKGVDPDGTPLNLDPKEASKLAFSIESHQRAQTLMSAQTRQANIEIQKNMLAGFRVQIQQGLYKSDSDLTNAMLRAGFPDLNAAMKELGGFLKEQQKEQGGMNFFAQAGADWRMLISTTKSADKKRSLQAQETEILYALQRTMQAKGLKNYDPKVMDEYRALKKAATSTVITEVKDYVKDWFGFKDTSDTFTGKAAPGNIQIPDRAAPAKMSEADARKQLTDKGITGKRQDAWITTYKANGVVE